MAVTRNVVDAAKFNAAAQLPYELRLQDFQMAMQDVYDFFGSSGFSVGRPWRQDRQEGGCGLRQASVSGSQSIGTATSRERTPPVTVPAIVSACPAMSYAAKSTRQLVVTGPP